MGNNRPKEKRDWGDGEVSDRDSDNPSQLNYLGSLVLVDEWGRSGSAMKDDSTGL